MYIRPSICAVLVAVLFSILLPSKAFSQWVDLRAPREISDSPNCSTWEPNQIDCFVRARDGSMNVRRWNRDAQGYGKWSAWASLAGAIAGPPNCLSLQSHRTDCFAQGTDGALVHIGWKEGSWSEWESLLRPKPLVQLTDSPSCVSLLTDTVVCFVRGSDGAMHVIARTADFWSDWTSKGGDIIGRPNCISSGQAIDCFAQGTNGALVHIGWKEGSWSEWESLLRPKPLVPLTDSPSCVVTSSNNINCFVRGADGAMHHKMRVHNNWGNWESLGGPTSNRFLDEPHCMSWGGAWIDCFVRGYNNVIYMRSWENNKWSDNWKNLEGDASKGFTCIAWASNRRDCLAVNAVGELNHRWWDGVRWNEPPESPSLFDPIPNSDLVRVDRRQGDADGDGLPDIWELERQRDGWDLRLDRLDMIIVPVLRPNISKIDVEPQIDMMREFFKRVPLQSVGGFTGINVIIRWGNLLPMTFSVDADPLIEYTEARQAGIPAELIGYARGLLIEVGPVPGSRTGQTPSFPGDWSTVLNHWPVFVHEIGHQFGLGHAPLSNNKLSPLYTSLMNYDYDYSFKNNLYKIHFSRGKFANISLDEKNLNETLPYSSEELRFLTYEPYEFSIEPFRSSPSTKTSVDWNRNRTHWEDRIAADINDGDGLQVREIGGGPHPGGGPFSKHQMSLGSIALTAYRDVLVGLTTEMSDVHGIPDADNVWRAYRGVGASKQKPGRLRYYVTDGNNVMKTELLNDSAFDPPFDMVGSPSITNFLQRILISYPSIRNSNENGIFVGLYELGNDRRLRKVSGNFLPTGTEMDVSVFTTPAGDAFFALREKSSGALSTQSILDNGPTLRFGQRYELLVEGFNTQGVGSERITWPAMNPAYSGVPPSFAYNNKTGTMMMLATSKQNNRLSLTSLKISSADHWVGSNEKWFADPESKTTERPAFLFDDSLFAGTHGRYFAYIRRADVEGALAKLEIVKVFPPFKTDSTPEAPFLSRKRIIGGWEPTRNAPAAVKYRSDIYLAYRKGTDDNDAHHNRFTLYFGASGEFDSGMTDFDDVGYIASGGLINNLESNRQ